MNYLVRDAQNQLWHLLITLSLALATFGGPLSAHAACFDGAKHFRGGQWKEWILHIKPGPVAVSKVEQILSEINATRVANQLLPLSHSKDSVIIFGVIDETNARGPNGERLNDRSSNQELFFATFADLPPSGTAIVFISDPLRSNSELTAAGVPGREASFAVETKVERRGTSATFLTEWIAQNDAGDHIEFSAKYANADVSTRRAWPPTREYLACNMSPIGTVLFRSLPLQAFSLLDRFQGRVINDFGKPSVHVDLKVRLTDPILHAIFNDPDNRHVALIEVDRVARLERLH